MHMCDCNTIKGTALPCCDYTDARVLTPLLTYRIIDTEAINVFKLAVF